MVGSRGQGAAAEGLTFGLFSDIINQRCPINAGCTLFAQELFVLL